MSTTSLQSTCMCTTQLKSYQCYYIVINCRDLDPYLCGVAHVIPASYYIYMCCRDYLITTWLTPHIKISRNLQMGKREHHFNIIVTILF